MCSSMNSERKGPKIDGKCIVQYQNSTLVIMETSQRKVAPGIEYHFLTYEARHKLIQHQIRESRCLPTLSSIAAQYIITAELFLS